jgi:hypothetical protein
MMKGKKVRSRANLVLQTFSTFLRAPKQENREVGAKSSYLYDIMLFQNLSLDGNSG